MCLKPVVAPAAVGDEGHAEGCGALHLANDDFFYALALFGHDAEVQFIVHLKDHA